MHLTIAPRGIRLDRMRAVHPPAPLGWDQLQLGSHTGPNFGLEREKAGREWASEASYSEKGDVTLTQHSQAALMCGNVKCQTARRCPVAVHFSGTRPPGR